MAVPVNRVTHCIGCSAFLGDSCFAYFIIIVFFETYCRRPIAPVITANVVVIDLTNQANSSTYELLCFVVLEALEPAQPEPAEFAEEIDAAEIEKKKKIAIIAKINKIEQIKKIHDAGLKERATTTATTTTKKKSAGSLNVWSGIGIFVAMTTAAMASF